MILKFKLFESSFYSKELLHSLFNLFKKLFDGDVVIISNSIVFTIYGYNNKMLLHNDIIYFKKTPKYIDIIFNRFYKRDYLYEIYQTINNELFESNINYDFFSQSFSRTTIRIYLADYNNVVSLINNLDYHIFDDIIAQIQSEKYNL